MTTYTTIADGEIDVSSPITESVLTRLRDNPLAILEGASGAPRINTAAIQNNGITSGHIYAGSVNQSIIAAGAVHTSELNTSTGTVTVESNNQEQGTNNHATLPGGQYGFWPRIKANSTSELHWDVNFHYGEGSTSYVNFVSVSSGFFQTGDYMTAEQTYINSSPPYNIGNGDIAHFIYLKIDNTTGDIVGTYAADAPPWAYNGPTDIRADIYDKQGRPWRFKRTFENDNDLETDFDMQQSKIKNCIKSRRAVNQYKKRVIDWAEIKNYIEPVTHEIKNADITLVPQPMNIREGKSIVLLNPTSNIVDDLALLAEEKVNLSELLHNGYLTIDNESVDVAAPPGVKIVNAKWKDTGS